jgi:TonB family protein
VQEAVSAVLVDRAREAEGLSRMLVFSVAAHVALVAAVWIVPSAWLSRTRADESVMTISLGGVPGPDTGGMTSIADRAVQSIAKPDAPKAVETPPAAKVPEMVEPERIARPKPSPARPIEKPAEKSSARKPTAGAEIKSGSARVSTGGAPVPFGGLAQGGGGAGAGVRLDVQNFCCPEYLALMVQKVRQNWNANQGAGGQPIVKFTIRRDGMITNVELEQSSGQALLDLEARRAVFRTMKLQPLPREFTGNSLTVHLTFDFKR